MLDHIYHYIVQWKDDDMIIKRYLLSVIAVIAIMGCGSKSNELSVTDTLSVPVLLLEDDAVENDEMIISSLKRRLYENSFFDEVGNVGGVRLSFAIESSLTRYGVSSITAIYLPIEDSNNSHYIKAEYPVEFSSCGDGRGMCLYVSAPEEVTFTGEEGISEAMRSVISKEIPTLHNGYITARNVLGRRL